MCAAEDAVEELRLGLEHAHDQQAVSADTSPVTDQAHKPEPAIHTPVLVSA